MSEARDGARGGDGGREAEGRPGAAFGAAGASTSRNTSVEVLCLPDLERSSAAGLDTLGGAPPTLETRWGSPYMRRCSSSIPRRWSLSDEMSVNSLIA